MPRPGIELHGHRGARGLWPENTIPGFLGTIGIGVTAIEMDVALTQDGVAILSHDPILDPLITRGPDGSWIEPPGALIRDLSYAALSDFDVGRIRPGSPQARAFPNQMGLDGVRLPRLADVIALDPSVHLAVELKTFPDHPERTLPPDAMAEAVLAVLDQQAALARTRIISFDFRVLSYLRRVRPALDLGYLTDAETKAAAGLWWDGASAEDFGGSIPRLIASLGGRVWGPDVAALTEAEVAEAHALGLLVNPWTVNESEDMARLLDWGVGALTTDYPDRARAVMAEKGIALR
ncbi:glycerophosphodiester phosphodiesterase [Acidisoma cellulosilytica]|uniref:Glycerophosphodiester phosphodiesterase n=1 Tax=Acidisoma cellulosilyticum TaxID=2802395 RepID=A0A964E2P3_9PROT|nr:glycerophosphodiester phosphodiesterase family protein [Acidisoma cellulosilyticum]MCB8879018.1 glycerophosphodiester phosphodiesterase [Acidisoma cellulosilyticum]